MYVRLTANTLQWRIVSRIHCSLSVYLCPILFFFSRTTTKHTTQRANNHVLIGILARFAHTDPWRSTERYWLSIKLSVKRPASKPENRSLEEEASWTGEGERTGVGGSILATREVETRGGLETKEKQPNQLRRNGSRIKPELDGCSWIGWMCFFAEIGAFFESNARCP